MAARREALTRFALSFVAGPEDIDRLGHVNNAVWVQWMEVLAVAHWEAVAPPEHQARYVWLLTRHEIDYRGNIREGERVTGETWVPEGPRGVRFDRRIDFRDDAGKVLVSARSTWAMIEQATGRPSRIAPEVAAPFLTAPDEAAD